MPGAPMLGCLRQPSSTRVYHPGPQRQVGPIVGWRGPRQQGFACQVAHIQQAVTQEFAPELESSSSVHALHSAAGAPIQSAAAPPPPPAAANGTEAAGSSPSSPPQPALEVQQQASEQTPAASKPKGSSFMNRVIFGTMLGLGGGAVVGLGKYFLLAVVVLVTYQATREYYGMITSKAITQKMDPPPALVSIGTHVLCVSITALAYFYKGRSGTVLAVSAFLLLVLQVVASRRPKFSQLATGLFGLFYCAWLPSFWVKLRMLAKAAPVVPYTGWVSSFSSWTVGLVATFTAVACVIAADTGAYFVGKAMGRTKLTDISPKKTVEGAIGGWASSVAVAMGLGCLTQWPATPLAAAGLGTVIFFSSLFGDLIESIMKRDAEMKDSGDLIPGHGGLLDRIDSYMFTGAVTYFYVVFILPRYGLAASGAPAAALLLL